MQSLINVVVTMSGQSEVYGERVKTPRAEVVLSAVFGLIAFRMIIDIYDLDFFTPGSVTMTDDEIYKLIDSYAHGSGPGFYIEIQGLGAFRSMLQESRMPREVSDAFARALNGLYAWRVASGLSREDIFEPILADYQAKEELKKIRLTYRKSLGKRPSPSIFPTPETAEKLGLKFLKGETLDKLCERFDAQKAA